jgi:hypothetical protein
MPAMTLAKSGKRYTHEEWVMMDPYEKDLLLSRHGPAYTDEAWKNNFGNRKPKR